MVKFLLNPITPQKMANLQKTVRRLIISFLACFPCLRQFGALTVEMSLNPVRTKKKTIICKVLSHASKSSHSPRFLVPFIKPTFWNCYFQILVEPHYDGNDEQFAKYCPTPRNNRFQEVFCCWSSVRHFGALTVKFAPNPIVAKNMANFLKHCHRPFIHCFPLVYLCVS